MKQIIADKNLVFLNEDDVVEVDCSSLLNQGYVFVGEDAEGLWAEEEDFVDRIRDFDTSIALGLFEQALFKQESSIKEEENFEFINGEWVLNIPKARAAQREVLKQSRDSIIKAPIDNFQGGRVEDRENIKDTSANWDMLGVSEIEWVMSDNSTRLVTKQDLDSIIYQYAIRKLNAFSLFNQLCEELETSTDPSTVNWPTTES